MIHIYKGHHLHFVGMSFIICNRQLPPPHIDASEFPKLKDNRGQAI